MSTEELGFNHVASGQVPPTTKWSERRSCGMWHIESTINSSKNHPLLSLQTD